jgi:hypothetical protein
MTSDRNVCGGSYRANCYATIGDSAGWDRDNDNGFRVVRRVRCSA